MQHRVACNLQRSLRLRTKTATISPSLPTGRSCAASASPSSSATTATSVIRSIQADLRSKRRSAEEVARQYLDAIALQEPTLHSFITTAGHEETLKQVRGGDDDAGRDGSGGDSTEAGGGDELACRGVMA